MSEKLYCNEIGDGTKALVLLHGFGGTHHAWKTVATALAGEVRILVYDLPGHGGSLHFPEAGPPKLAAKAILADLTERGVDRFHLAGHSMGGAVASLMALTEPSRIASLTLLAPGGFGAEINGRLLRRYGAARTSAEILACLEMMTGWGNAVSNETAEALETMRAQPGQNKLLVSIAAAITSGERQGMLPPDRLAELPMPVSVLWGRLDAVLPVHQSANLPPMFARHLLPDAGHMLPDEAPEVVVELLRRQMR